MSRVRQENTSEDLFSEWKGLRHRSDALIAFASGMVQNDYPGMTVEEVLDWKKEVVRNLNAFDDQVKKLLSKTLAFLLVEGEEEDAHLLEDDVPY